MTSAMTASHVSLSSSSANPRKTIKCASAIYSLVAAIVVLLLGATLNNNILPVLLIGLMAIACTGQVILV